MAIYLTREDTQLVLSGKTFEVKEAIDDVKAMLQTPALQDLSEGGGVSS
jgi:hypothetical protein